MNRFSVSGWDVLKAAADLGTSLGSPEITSGHLLLALAETPGPVADALNAAGLDRAALTRAVTGGVERRPRPLSEHLPFSEDAKMVYDRAPDVALAAGRQKASAADLLAAVADVPGGAAMRTLTGLGWSVADVRGVARQAAV